MKNKSNSDIFNKDVIYQVSLLQSLANGDYRGSVTVKELKQHGNTGIGTFDKLNGELIMLDGVVYRASGNGSVNTVSKDETTPFAVVTYLNGDFSAKLNDVPDYETLITNLNQIVEENGKNHFYAIRIDGLFTEINVRSVPAQIEPYKRLVEVLEEQQTFFDYENICGTIVGIYCPPYMSHLNASGWHMHFISDDRTKGGHVLGAKISNTILTMDTITSFQLELPQNEKFNHFDFTIDQSQDIEKIETNR